MNDLFKRPERRPIHDLNIVPIIDMFIIIIFFLLLSTAFITLTKLTVPPSKVSILEVASKIVPLSPKVFLEESNSQINIMLKWEGENPGVKRFQATKTLDSRWSHDVDVAMTKLVSDFSRIYPRETSIQMGMTRNAPYQSLVSLMDSVQKTIPNVVLISYQEAERAFASQVEQ